MPVGGLTVGLARYADEAAAGLRGATAGAVGGERAHTLTAFTFGANSAPEREASRGLG